MAQLRLIQGFLLMILQLTVAADQTSVLKRAGDEVILKCSTVIDGQQKCSSTTWIFGGSGNRASVELVELGQINNDITKADRLSLTADCSLVIKKVREEDAGSYYCQQWKIENKDSQTKVHESTLELSVLSMTKQKKNQRVKLSCSVVTSDPCRYKVKWFNQDVDNKEPPSETVCSATVSLSSGSEFPQCKVTDTVTDEEFTFSLQSSEKTEAEDKSTKKPDDKKTTKPETNNVQTTSEGKFSPTLTSARETSENMRPKSDNPQTTPQENKIPNITELSHHTTQIKKTSTKPVIKNKEHSTTKRTTVTVAITNSQSRASTGKGPAIIAGVVVSVIILIIAVVIIRWRAKGKKTQTDENCVDLKENVYYSTIKHPQKTNVNAKDGGDSDAVYYSTVRASPSSAAASDDPNNLYSVITSIN